MKNLASWNSLILPFLHEAKNSICRKINVIFYIGQLQ